MTMVKIDTSISKELKSCDKQMYSERERTPKKIYSSLNDTPTLSPSTSFSSLDSGFIHGETSTPPQDYLSPDGLDVGASKQHDQVVPETSTPVLTRVSILRTSSQRTKSWNSSQRQQVDQKDSVRFKLSIPLENYNSFSDSDSDSQTGLYSINTLESVNRPKRRRRERPVVKEKDWEPVVVQSLKDDKQTVRHKIKAGYVSQIKQIFSINSDFQTDDNYIGPRKSTLRRHKSANDVTKTYLSVANFSSSSPERTHSLLNLTDRPDLSSLRHSYETSGEPKHLNEVPRAGQLTSPVLKNTPSSNANDFHSDKNFTKNVILENKMEKASEPNISLISRNQVSRRPVPRHRTESRSRLNSNEVKSEKGNISSSLKTSQQKDVGNFARSKSLRTFQAENKDVPCFRKGSVRSINMATSAKEEKISFLRTGSLRATDALKNFLEKQYPSDENQHFTKSGTVEELKYSSTVYKCSHQERNIVRVNSEKLLKSKEGTIPEHGNSTHSQLSKVSESGIHSKTRKHFPSPQNTSQSLNTDSDISMGLQENKTDMNAKSYLSVSEKILVGVDTSRYRNEVQGEYSVPIQENLTRKGNTSSFTRIGSERIPRPRNDVKQNHDDLSANFQRVGSERITSQNKHNKDTTLKLRSSETKSKTSTDALKSFLKNRYPAHKNNEDKSQKEKNIQSLSQFENDAKSEMNDLILKFGLRSKTEDDWNINAQLKVREYDSEQNNNSVRSRQIDPALVQCLTPPVSPNVEMPNPLIASTLSDSHPQELNSCYFSDNTISELSPRENRISPDILRPKEQDSAPYENLHSHEKPHNITNVSEIIVMGENERGIDVNSCSQSEETPGVLSGSMTDSFKNENYLTENELNDISHKTERAIPTERQTFEKSECNNPTDKVIIMDTRTFKAELLPELTDSSDEHDYSSMFVNKTGLEAGKYLPQNKAQSSHRSVTFLVRENVLVDSNRSEFTTSLNGCDFVDKHSSETGHTLQQESVLNINECIPSKLSPSYEPLTVVSEIHIDSDLKGHGHFEDIGEVNNVHSLQNENFIEKIIDPEINTFTLSTLECEKISQKKSPPKKPPRKRKSNPKIGGLQSSLTSRNVKNVPEDEYQSDEIKLKESVVETFDFKSESMNLKGHNNLKTDENLFAQDLDTHLLSIKCQKDGEMSSSRGIDSFSSDKDEAMIFEINDKCPLGLQTSNNETVDVDYEHGDNHVYRNKNDLNTCLVNLNETRTSTTCVTAHASAVPITEHKLNNHYEDQIPMSNETPENSDLVHSREETPTISDHLPKERENQKKSVRLLGRFNSKDVNEQSKDSFTGTVINEKSDDVRLKHSEEELCASFLDFKDTWNSRRRNRNQQHRLELSHIPPKLSEIFDRQSRSVDSKRTNEPNVDVANDRTLSLETPNSQQYMHGKDDNIEQVYANPNYQKEIGNDIVNCQASNTVNYIRENIVGSVGIEGSSTSISSDSSEEGEYVVETPLIDTNHGADWNPGIKSECEYPIFDEKGENIIAEVYTIRSDYSDESFKGKHKEENQEPNQDLRNALKLNLDYLNEEQADEFVDVTDDSCQYPLLQVTNEMKNDSYTELNTHSGDYNNTSSKPKRFVTFDVSSEEGKVIHACHTRGSDHVTSTGKTLTTENPQLKDGDGSVSTNTESVNDLDLKTNSCQESEEPSKIAIIRDISSGVKMPEKSSGSTKTSQMSEYKGGKKITTKTTSSVNDNGYNDDEQTEQKRSLALLTEAISKLNGENTDDIIPEINQTVTKLNGGNLVITTLTHKIVEEEDEQEKRATDMVPSEMNQNTYIVQDHKGDTYMIEDITDEYSSSERRYHTEYETASPGSESPVYQRINNLRAHGQSGIDHETAEEVLLSLYNPHGMEFSETDERSYSGTYSRENMQVQPYGYSDSSSMKRTTAYEYEDGGSPYGSSSMKTVKQSYEMSSAPQINPYFVQQPLILPPFPVPQYNLLQLEPVPQKVTTGVQVVTEQREQKEEPRIVTSTDETDSKHFKERPVYKSVALVKGPYESPKWHTAKKHKPYEPPDEVDSGRMYKVVKSSASDDVREETLAYEESTRTTTTMKAENAGFSGGQFFDENRNVSSIEMGNSRPLNLTGHGVVNLKHTQEKRPFRSTVEVNGGTGRKPYDQLDGYQSKLSTYLNHQQNYQGTPEQERKVYTDVDRNMKVVRGNILIKNNFEDGLDEFNDNINVFDNGFNMSKSNPLYNSDEDIYKRYEEEKRRQQERDIRDMENMAFETVDRFSKSKNVTRKADGERRKPRSKQNLTNLLLTRLSTMDSKDIRQTLDVKHHHEDVYGDPHLEQADGTSSRRITNSNYDTVTENVDLEMKDGKAYITITVTAERLTPIDYEFHVWRKNQAIVTRVVEIDFYADEQRRMLYDRVMDRVDDEGYSTTNKYSHYTRRKPQEVVLSSQDTLELFNELMDAAGGEGDREDITVKTKRNKTLLPENPFLY